MEKLTVRLLLNRAKDYDFNFRLARLHAWRFLLFVSGFCFAPFLHLRSSIKVLSLKDQLGPNPYSES
jgi:hypothetical protein